ncbi:MAG TPA: transglutaminase family protein [Thermoplasmatales archaeon]|nr:transglutaminase family protein [Thermoplasmatales archaeon]
MQDDEVVSKKLKLFIFKGIIALGFVLATNLGTFMKLRKGEKEIYKRPPRRYEIPKYRMGMKYCQSDEKYLRPTLYCNCRAPEIIAMANKLGAFKKSDYEYAKDVFEFVKRNVILEFLPMDDVVDTLRRGTGTCIHKISLFIALCRAAGIKARYKLYAPIITEAWYEHLVGADPLAGRWYNAMGYFILHGEGEVYIDGKWVVADVGPTPERQAAQGIPITKFGEDSIGTWFYAVPNTITKIECLSKLTGRFGSYLSNIFMKKLAPASFARINNSILQQIEKGKKILEEMGEEEYDEQARKKYKPRLPEVELIERPEIVFESD